MLMEQKSETLQQKILSGNTQRPTIVEVRVTTYTQDVINVRGSRGEMVPYDPNSTRRKPGWMLFELAWDIRMSVFSLAVWLYVN